MVQLVSLRARIHSTSATPIADCHNGGSTILGGRCRQGAFLYHVPMLVLGIESSCDETGLALYDNKLGLLTQTLHSRVALPNYRYCSGIRVPRPCAQNRSADSQSTGDAGKTLNDLDAIAYTAGPGLMGALLVGASFAKSLATVAQRSRTQHSSAAHCLRRLSTVGPRP